MPDRRPGDPPRPELPWIELVEGGVETVRVAGNHMTMHEPPNLKNMAAHLRLALELRQEPHSLARLLPPPAVTAPAARESPVAVG